MNTDKNPWTKDRREKIGPHSKLPASHPVSQILAAAGFCVEAP